MAKLSRSFREKNKTTRQFREQYSRLPLVVQALTRIACEMFDANLNHRSLRLHQLKVTSGSKAEQESYSISINMQYRAIYVVQHGLNIWYWIGSHADYDKFSGM